MAKKPQADMSFDEAFNSMDAKNEAPEDTKELETEQTTEAENSDVKPDEVAQESDETAADESAEAPAEESQEVAEGTEMPVEAEPVDDRDEKLKKYEHRAESDSGRISALQAKIADLEAQLAAQQSSEPEMEEPGEMEEPAEAPQSGNPLESIREDFPELADAVEQAIQMGVAQALHQFRQELIQEQLAALDGTHQGWQDTIGSEGFSKWIGEQPDHVKNLMNSNSASTYRHILDSYGKAQAPAAESINPVSEAEPNPEAEAIKAKRANQLAQAASVKSVGAAPKGGDIPPDDFNAAWDYLAKSEKKNYA